MSDETAGMPETLALNTKLEDEFVSPLTAVRGALEILRDFPDLERQQRQHFIERALDECGRLQQGIDSLAATVYAAGRRGGEEVGQGEPVAAEGYGARIRRDPAAGIMELDFSDFQFTASSVVNEVFDVVDRVVMASGRQWYFLVNFRNCSVWPEAWIAFAHRGKKVNVNYSLGTVRYSELADGEAPAGDPETLPSRATALARIDEMKRAAG